MGQSSRFRSHLNGVFILLGLLAVLGLVITSWNYYVGLDSVAQIRVIPRAVGVTDNRLQADIVIVNPTAEPVSVVGLEFTVYLNQSFIASNEERQMAERLDPGQQLTITQEVRLSDLFVQRVAQARAQDEMQWSLRGRIRMMIPRSDRTLFVRFSSSVMD